MTAASILGVFNAILLYSFRNSIARLFTNNTEVIDLVTKVISLCAAIQLVDALAVTRNGLLCGLGFQEIGGWTNLLCYYVVALPISFGTAFKLKWELEGLWTGIAISLGLVAAN
jgi:multidrug resistance protein, MATE family